ncbi:hypothetical protein [Paraburkholderia sp. Ac-20347]|uniref:hypothetical protein n=1 Tax=Paraburkholderia sp. Ac-20347 TaxID=2703892 RepID=UPI001F126E0A|nr:hypothetical protein [Paraburkholderia sp. Ac-20347]
MIVGVRMVVGVVVCMCVIRMIMIMVVRMIVTLIVLMSASQRRRCDRCRFERYFAMTTVIAMTTAGRLTIVPRLLRRCARCRACAVRAVRTGARPIAASEHKPRQECLTHGRVLPKMTESLDSL